MVQSQCGTSLDATKIEAAMIFLFGQDYRGRQHEGGTSRWTGGKGHQQRWQRKRYAYAAYDYQKAAVEQAMTAHDRSTKQFWEVYSGSGHLSQAMQAYGYQVRTFDLNNGWDFTVHAHRKKFMKMLRQECPDFVWLAPPCTIWSPLQELTPRTPEENKPYYVKETIRNMSIASSHAEFLMSKHVMIEMLELNNQLGPNLGRLPPANKCREKGTWPTWINAPMELPYRTIMESNGPSRSPQHCAWPSKDLRLTWAGRVLDVMNTCLSRVPALELETEPKPQQPTNPRCVSSWPRSTATLTCTVTVTIATPTQPIQHKTKINHHTFRARRTTITTFTNRHSTTTTTSHQQSHCTTYHSTTWPEAWTSNTTTTSQATQWEKCQWEATCFLLGTSVSTLRTTSSTTTSSKEWSLKGTFFNDRIQADTLWLKIAARSHELFLSWWSRMQPPDLPSSPTT